MMVLRSTDSSPSRPNGTSTPEVGLSQTGQVLVAAGCQGHCDCVECARCIYCGSCESCNICKKCQTCKYPARQLKMKSRPTLSNDAIKRRIGGKSKANSIKPLSLDDIISPKLPKTNTGDEAKTKCVDDKSDPSDQKLETVYVGDKLKPNDRVLETKNVGDQTIKKTEDNKTGPVLVSGSNQKKVSGLFNFNINIKVKDLSTKEQKLISFCERRIVINNRRLQIQKSYRETGMCDQVGTFRLHDSTDPDYWVTISMVGYTDIIIPRCGLFLLGYINFCPFIKWEVISFDGHKKSDLTFIGQILNEHVMFDNRVSVQPIRFSPADRKNELPPSNDATLPPVVNSPVNNPSVAGPPSTGLPPNPPIWENAPIFVWRAQDRNLGSPVSRRRDHMTNRHGLPNLTIFNGATRLIHNGQPTDPVNEEREMIFIAT